MKPYSTRRSPGRRYRPPPARADQPPPQSPAPESQNHSPTREPERSLFENRLVTQTVDQQRPSGSSTADWRAKMLNAYTNEQTDAKVDDWAARANRSRTASPKSSPARLPDRGTPASPSERAPRLHPAPIWPGRALERRVFGPERAVGDPLATGRPGLFVATEEARLGESGVQLEAVLWAREALRKGPLGDGVALKKRGGTIFDPPAMDYENLRVCTP